MKQSESVAVLPPVPLRPALVSAVLMASVLLVSACASKEAVVTVQPTPVRTAPATSGPAQPPITTAGQVASRDEMRLSFKLGGVIRRIAVREGDEVKRGQRLAEIELTEVGAQVEQTRQLANKARRDLDRGERLYADQVISLEQLQDLRTQDSVAQAALKSAQFNLGYSTIVAPVDGVVLRRLVEEREQVAPGAPVLTIGARNSGQIVRLALADREVVQLGLGDPAEIRLDAFPNDSLRGTVSEISRAADARSGLFPVEVRIESPPRELASGLVAKLTLSPASARDSTLTYVPIAAVVEGNGLRASVFVLAGERARRRPVRVAFLVDDQVALAEGLTPGETIVTDGALYLQDNERVTVADAPAAPASPPNPASPLSPTSDSALPGSSSRG